MKRFVDGPEVHRLPSAPSQAKKPPSTARFSFRRNGGRRHGTVSDPSDCANHGSKAGAGHVTLPGVAASDSAESVLERLVGNADPPVLHSAGLVGSP